MDFQSAFNVAIGIIAFLFGAVVTSMRSSHAALVKADLDLVEKVQAIEVLVAGEYVKRDEMKDMWQIISNKLDRIEGKLASKEDRAGKHTRYEQ